MPVLPRGTLRIAYGWTDRASTACWRGATRNASSVFPGRGKLTDVAAGYLVLTEAGGEVTDVAGLPIDFSEIGAPQQGGSPGGGRRRAKLPDSVRGIVGSCGGALHRALLDAHAEIRGRTP